MRNKKLVSTIAATALAATMAMPVMAADGGSIDVPVDTRTAVIRVAVPTSLEIAVNQFEKGDQGSQIYSGAFDITNKSEIPVKLTVTSTATLNSTKPIGLVSTKAEAENSTAEDGEAWMAVAAQTSANKYIEESGKDVKDLTEANANVATFVQDETDKSTAKTEQVYYLKAEDPQSTATTPVVTYVKVAPTNADELAAAKDIAYAQFHELTALTTQPTSDAEVQAEVDKADIYAIDGSGALSFTAKGKTGATYANGSTYYTAVSAVVEAKDLAVNKIYVYGETAGDGGKAGFRYIGKLSDKETWTNADISKVVIAYDIKGVTETKYNDVKDDCTYGLYADPAAQAPTVPTTDASSITAGGAAVEFAIPDGITVTKVEKTKADGSFNELPADHYTWEDTAGGKKLTLKASFTTSYGTGKKIKVSFSSGDPIELNVQ